jgi:hypothetical protein
MVLSQPSILPAEMPGQQGAKSVWQLPVTKIVNFCLAGYWVCLTAENLQGVKAALKLPSSISATSNFT